MIVITFRCTGRHSDTPRQQVNKLTSYIDGSVVYGSSESRNRALREFKDGKLKLGSDGLIPVSNRSLWSMWPSLPISHPYLIVFLAAVFLMLKQVSFHLFSQWKSAMHYTGQCIIHLHLSLCKRELGYKCASKRMVYPRVHWVGFCFITVHIRFPWNLFRIYFIFASHTSYKYSQKFLWFALDISITPVH